MSRIEATLHEKLSNSLSPQSLVITNESYKHAGHAGVAGVAGDQSGETHFHIKVISPKFVGQSRVQRHKLVYSILENEMNNPIHALSLELTTPDEKLA